MSIAALIRDMAAAGATPEAIAIAVDAIEAVNAREAERKAKRAKQKADQRARKDATVARQSRDSAATVATNPPSLNDVQPNPDNVQVSLNPPPYSPPALKIAGDAFAGFWATFPKRQGGNSRKNAECRFRSAVKAGVSAEMIIDGARRYAEHCDATGKTGTEFVKTAEAWLNGRFWESDWSISLSRPGPPHRQAPNRRGLIDALHKEFPDDPFPQPTFPRLAFGG